VPVAGVRIAFETVPCAQDSSFHRMFAVPPARADADRKHAA
jgi:hypothetical protein